MFDWFFYLTSNSASTSIVKYLADHEYNGIRLKSWSIKTQTRRLLHNPHLQLCCIIRVWLRILSTSGSKTGPNSAVSSSPWPIISSTSTKSSVSLSSLSSIMQFIACFQINAASCELTFRETSDLEASLNPSSRHQSKVAVNVTPNVDNILIDYILQELKSVLNRYIAHCLLGRGWYKGQLLELDLECP